MGELMRYTQQEQRVPMRDRAVARRSKAVYDEVRISGMMAEGSTALAAHIMNGLSDLDSVRVQLSDDNPALAMALGDIMSQAVKQAMFIQRDLFKSKWRL